MSLGAVRNDFWQLTASSTIKERCQAIFNHELLSDVKFVVRDSQGGCESKKIPAHKFVLAISSPVFFAMFYGELAETKDSVDIYDCEYESLLELFRFIYSDEANLNPDNVMQLMYLAKKYMLHSLADICSAFLQKNLDASNDEANLTASSTIKERCQAIFNHELLSDVKFVVRDSQGGCESKKIPAHKFVLAISSPVFFAMFYGELAETKDSVDIYDCEYESLLELFRFIYSDEANLNPDNVMQLMYLAKKYMLHSLADICSAFLQKNLDASNVFHVLPHAQIYEEKDLLGHCWKIIEKETEEAVKSDGFVTIERSVLEELVEKDWLNIKEVELFKAVDCWAEKECEKQGLVAEGSVKRRILGERIVKGIRFPLMEQEEFASVVLGCDILSWKELVDMMEYFNGELSIPVGFSGAKRAGHQYVISRFRSLNHGWQYYSDKPNAIRLEVNKNIKLHAVRLFGSENNEYSVTLAIKLAGFFKTKKVGKFLSQMVQGEMGNYQGFQIVFEPPFALQKYRVYDFNADITGPPSLYGQSGQSIVEHSEVTFRFLDWPGHSVVVEGQFSEFVFTVD